MKLAPVHGKGRLTHCLYCGELLIYLRDRRLPPIRKFCSSRCSLRFRRARSGAGKGRLTHCLYCGELLIYLRDRRLPPTRKFCDQDVCAETYKRRQGGVPIRLEQRAAA